jgi:hypothetical protein
MGDAAARLIVEQGNCVWPLTDPLIPTCVSRVLPTARDNLNRFGGFLSVKEETAKAVVVGDSGHAPR